MLATDRTVAAPKRLRWQTAEVREIIAETPRVKSLVLHVADWPGHLPGQHVDVRLIGEDGYQARRSYSIASAPEGANLILTLERIE
jgi:ferredoxin-NADP reductase